MPPSKVTVPRVDALFGLLRLGLTRKAAAGSVGITHDTLINWQHRDPDLLAAMEVAEAQAEAAYTEVLRRAAVSGSWQAAACWLERRRPSAWGRRARLDEPLELRAMAESLVARLEAGGLDRIDAASILAEAEAILAASAGSSPSG